MTGRKGSAFVAVLLGALLVGCQVEVGDGSDTAVGVAATDSAAIADTAGAALLDPNNATREQLVALPGMVPTAVDTLIARRPYDGMTAVNRVLTTQLDSAQRGAVYTRMWKPINLNTASDEEILLIPGVGQRMLHEFKEYRPYTSIEQFRRDIGKYVDDDEVARLERYVVIR